MGRSWLAAMLGACLSVATPRAEEDGLAPRQAAAIEAAVRANMGQRHVPSVVILVDRGGRRVFSRAWGKRDVANDLAADVDTVYEYGSLTKQFTGMAIFLLAQDGKLTLEDPVGRWLPEFTSKSVKIRELLVHTSGLHDVSEPPEYTAHIGPLLAVGPEVIVDHAAAAPLDFEPGTQVHYDNAAYVLLARIVERAGQQSFEDFLRTRIFKPAGMTKAGPFEFLALVPNKAAGYLWWEDRFDVYLPNAVAQGAKAGALVHSLPFNLRQADGAGFMAGTAADLQSWNTHLLAGTQLKGKWRDLYFTLGTLADGTPAFTSPEHTAIFCHGGLARFTRNGHVIYGAVGGTLGFVAFTATIPDRSMSVTILTNLGQVADAPLTEPILAALLE